MLALARKKALREIFVAYWVVTFAAALLNLLPDVAMLRDLTALGTALLFLFAALELSQRAPGDPQRFAVTLDGFLEPPSVVFKDWQRRRRMRERRSSGPVPPSRSMRPDAQKDAAESPSLWRSAARECGFAILVAGITFPPFVVAFYLFQQPRHAFVGSLPREFLAFALSHFLVTAIPEEAFFRGYIQTRLSDVFVTRTKIFGVEVSMAALVVQAALFALIHLVTDFSPARLAVFFPGLLFGWMRAKRNGIGAAAIYHALCNILSEVLFLGWIL